MATGGPDMIESVSKDGQLEWEWNGVGLEWEAPERLFESEKWFK